MSQNKNLVSELVTKFIRNFEEYKNPKFNEAQVRIEFVNPFWKALGWDVDNDKGYSFAYRDVIHEDEVKIGRTTKAPDYSFRIGGSRVFFVETKKPSIDLKHDPAPAFQLRRYAYSAKLPISILTDFEEFIIYDCRMKPALSDKPHVGRILYYTFEEYLDKWDEISGMLSKEAIQQGELDRYIKKKEGKKPKAEIDRDFLNDLDNWRIQLARNIALRNPQLNERELNYAVQLTIDRLIFLRMSEDRGIETQFTLQALLGGENIYRRLVQIYYKADERYNSGLFHFEEKDGPNPDTITPDLTLDDKIIKEIIGALYYPKCPYEFSVLPVEVLGNAYEQFLGKRISLTKGHHARIEEKPEVRKAGGVYYTPKYIVDYIVKNTVGKLCANKTPKEISELRILDPACGSGSFLIGAFKYLLDWHLEYYKKEFEKTGQIPASPLPKGQRKRKSDPQVIFKGAGDNWYLGTAEKKRILINNIFGVDIDANAVEVTKLSLLLKVLENENSETLNRQLGLWHERALPNLEHNIKCGNSLIGPDFYDNQQSALFDEEEMYRINVFDWQSEFKEIFDKGGFNAVIGNPPYIGFHGFIKEKEYLKKHFITASGKFDIYIPFIERGINNIKEKGILGYICPTNFTKRGHGVSLREILSKNITINEICDFKHKQIFKGATNYTGIFVFEKKLPKNNSFFLYKENSLDDAGIEINQNSLSKKPWIFRNPKALEIVHKIAVNKNVDKLGNLTIGISEGIVTGKNDVFLLKKNEAITLELEQDLLMPCIRGKDIFKYHLNNISEIVIYPYKLINNKTVALSEKELSKYPKIFKYLTLRKEELKGRGYFDTSSKFWFELWCPRKINLLNNKKIVVPEIAEKNRFTFANANVYYGDTVCGITLKHDLKENLFYILGLLNSNLIEYFFKNISVPKAGGYFIYKTMFLKEILVRLINFQIQTERDIHDQIVVLVQKIHECYNKQDKVKEPQSQKQLQRQIEATDKQIDRLVYQLYDLTEEEIKIVEEAVK